jgi:hypothetical protein
MFVRHAISQASRSQSDYQRLAFPAIVWLGERCRTSLLDYSEPHYHPRLSTTLQHKVTAQEREVAASTTAEAVYFQCHPLYPDGLDPILRQDSAVMEMQKRRFGAGGPQVGAIGLGCMSCRGIYGPADVAKSNRTKARALKLGIDT